jgi:homoserine dehydrogenase
MEQINIAIVGCGTVGGGVAQIISEMNADLAKRASKQVNLCKIVELKPKAAAERFGIPLSLFCGNGDDLTPAQANGYIKEIIESKDIDLVVETVGGKGDFVHQLCVDVSEKWKALGYSQQSAVGRAWSGYF